MQGVAWHGVLLIKYTIYILQLATVFVDVESLGGVLCVQDQLVGWLAEVTHDVMMNCQNRNGCGKRGVETTARTTVLE